MLPKVVKQLATTKTLPQTSLLLGRLEATKKVVTELLKLLQISSHDQYLVGSDPSVKELRPVIQRTQLRPISGSAIALVLMGVDNWSNEAVSALLKIIEEPPTYLKVILTAEDLGSVLPTIRSRSAKFYVHGEEKDKTGLNNLTDLMGQSAAEASAKIKSIVDSESPQEVLSGWLQEQSPVRQRVILERRRLLGNISTNKRLTLEALLRELRRTENDS